MMRVVLASGSPRRRELLKKIYKDFEVLTSDVDESIDLCKPDDNVEARRRINADNTDFVDVVEYADLCIKNEDISIHDLALYIYDFYGTKTFYKRFYAKEIADD